MSPAMIIECCPRPNFSANHIAFDAYEMVHTGTIKNMKAREISTITLKSLNQLGGYIFMSLLSGKKMRGVKWTQKPIPDKSIVRVEYLAGRENMPLLDSRELIFEWAPGHHFDLYKNMLNEVGVGVDDINTNNDITEGNDFNDEIINHIFEDAESDDDTSAHYSTVTNNIEIDDNDNNNN